VNRFTTLRGAVVPLLQDDVDTDQIIPARFLVATGKEGMGEHLFADWRHGPGGAPRPGFVLNRPGMAGRRVLLAGANFGSGSSREHAAWALSDFGFRAVVATSFADIFRSNALKNGLLPVELAPEAHRRLVAAVEADPGAEVEVDLAAAVLRLPDGGEAPFPIDPFAQAMLLEGRDELGYLLARLDAVAAYEAAHPTRISTLRPVAG
jgi:3-isopropylmalate/(R)-2-methylmalate dehydratase small subunit